MQKPEKAPEPSMEEILASIRKIIAEEPIGSRPGPAPLPVSPEVRKGAPPGGPRERIEPSGFPAPRRDGEPHAHYSVEDALADLIDDVPARSSPASGRSAPDATPQASSTNPVPGSPAMPEPQRPSWLFARPSTVPAPSGAPAVVGGGTDSPQGRSLPPLDAAPPLSPQPSAATVPDRAGGTASKLERQADLGPVLPAAGQTKAPGTDGAGKPFGPRPLAGDTINRPNDRETAEAPAARSPKGEETRAPGGASSAATQSAAAPSIEPKSEIQRKAEPGPLPRNEAGPLPRKETSPLEDLAKGLAGARQDVIPARPAPQREASAPAPASVSAAAPVRSLEDTVADLLRPMLRDWLDANMPRIVEKALRVELAEGAKRPSTSDPA
jgi:cell pole-organizing protein PopZ